MWLTDKLTIILFLNTCHPNFSLNMLFDGIFPAFLYRIKTNLLISTHYKGLYEDLFAFISQKSKWISCFQAILIMTRGSAFNSIRKEVGKYRRKAGHLTEDLGGHGLGNKIILNLSDNQLLDLWRWSSERNLSSFERVNVVFSFLVWSTCSFSLYSQW